MILKRSISLEACFMNASRLILVDYGMSENDLLD